MSVPARDRWGPHRHRTRDAILGAVVELLHDEHPAAVSMPKVAARAGVSTRTLYRYFPDKDELLDAAAGWFDADARAHLDRPTPTAGDLRAYLRELWTLLAEHLSAVAAQHTGALGRELRRRRLERTREDLARWLPDAVPAERRADTVDLVAALTSSSMLLELVDRMGHAPEHAADLVTRVTELVLADATRPPDPEEGP